MPSISVANVLLTAMQDEDQQVGDGRNNLLSFIANSSWDTQHSVGLSDEITRFRIPAKVRKHSFPPERPDQPLFSLGLYPVVILGSFLMFKVAGT